MFFHCHLAAIVAVKKAAVGLLGIPLEDLSLSSGCFYGHIFVFVVLQIDHSVPRWGFFFFFFPALGIVWDSNI